MSTITTRRQRIVVLGGGFGGVYTAKHLSKLFRNRDDIEIALVNKENYFVFQPLLPEVVSGNIGLLDTVCPLNRLLPKCRVYVRGVAGIDLEQRTIELEPGFRPQADKVAYDHLVLAVGNVTDFRGMSGLQDHAMPFKNIADAIRIRNHLLHVLQEADVEDNPDHKRQLLTFVVAGGGFSGVELVAEMNDFLRRICRHYNNIKPDELRVVLIHSGEQILQRELEAGLGQYAQKILRRRGVEILLKSRLRTATPEGAILDDGQKIPTKTLISTVPSTPNPLLDLLALPKARGKLLVDQQLNIQGSDHVWAVGDCAAAKCEAGGEECPPTAQHAVRQAKVVASNIHARITGKPLVDFSFRGLGKMGAVGRHSAVAELFGKIRIAGFPAWVMWRTIYWSKLPGLDRKLKVGLSWFLDFIIPPETVQLKLDPVQAINQLHYEPGEYVFRQHNLGDALFIVLEGQAEVILGENEEERVVATVGPGEFFGEMALLSGGTRSASVRCATPLTVLAFNRRDFQTLVTNLPGMRHSIQNVMNERLKQPDEVAQSAESP